MRNVKRFKPEIREENVVYREVRKSAVCQVLITLLCNSLRAALSSTEQH